MKFLNYTTIPLYKKYSIIRKKCRLSSVSLYTNKEVPHLLPQQAFTVGLSVEKSKERNALLSPLFSSPPFAVIPTLHLSFLTSAENGYRKMTTSFLFRVLFYFYSRRVSKTSN